MTVVTTQSKEGGGEGVQRRNNVQTQQTNQCHAWEQQAYRAEKIQVWSMQCMKQAGKATVAGIGAPSNPQTGKLAFVCISGSDNHPVHTTLPGAGRTFSRTSRVVHACINHRPLVQPEQPVSSTGITTAVSQHLSQPSQSCMQ